MRAKRASPSAVRSQRGAASPAVDSASGVSTVPSSETSRRQAGAARGEVDHHAAELAARAEVELEPGLRVVGRRLPGARLAGQHRAAACPPAGSRRARRARAAAPRPRRAPRCAAARCDSVPATRSSAARASSTAAISRGSPPLAGPQANSRLALRSTRRLPPATGANSGRRHHQTLAPLGSTNLNCSSTGARRRAARARRRSAPAAWRPAAAARSPRRRARRG